MWAIVESGSITKMYTRPRAFKIGSNQYPANTMALWSESELQSIGVYPVTIDSTNLKNKEYYINTDITYAVDGLTVGGTYGAATAKAIADTLFTAQDETDGLGTEGEVATRGLKYNHKQIINSQAAGLLQDTDWMVIREAEGGTAVPSATTTWRAAVRTKANAMQVQIDGAADVDALAALYVYTYADPDDLTSARTRPLGEFPTL
tara:strand:- start:285 stop:899 length:615 start_codon:yes stop_codon:yes gene_type:complete